MPKLELSIRNLTLGISVAGVSAIVAFGVAAIYSTNWIEAGQEALIANAEMSSTAANMNVSLASLADRHLGLLTATSVEGLTDVTSREPIDARFNADVEKFEAIRLGREGSGESSIDAKAIARDYAAMASADAALEQRVRQMLELDRRMETLVEQADAEVAAIQEASNGILGKISLESRRAKRQLKKLLKNAGGDAGGYADSGATADLIERTRAYVLGQQARVRDAGQALQLNVSGLAAIARRFMLAENPDLMVSIRQNEAAQLDAAARRALKLMTRALADNPPLLEAAKALGERFELLLAHMLVGDDSLYAVKTEWLHAAVARDGAVLQILEAVPALRASTEQAFSQTQALGLESVGSTRTILETSETVTFVSIALVAAALLALGVFATRRITRPVDSLNVAMADIAEGEGDLTRRLAADGVQEAVELSRNFNRFVDKVRGLIGDVADTTADFTESVRGTARNAAAQKKRAERVQGETAQVAAAVHQVAQVVSNVSEHAARAAEEAGRADREAENGRNLVAGSQRSIETLAEQVSQAANEVLSLANHAREVTQVVDVIQGIADQTNLLALNAAIEAARAGEQGRGFAVVADEVRTLASRTRESTVQIEGIIERLQAGAEKVESVMREGDACAKSSVEQASVAGTALDSITEAVSSIRALNEEIASGSVEQSAAVDEISHSLEKIHTLSEENAAGANETSVACEALDCLGGGLARAIGQFKV